MHAERAALAHEAVEQHRCVLRHAVVVEEELLELVDHEENPRHARVGANLAETRDVLDARLAEQLAAAGELRIEALEHREAEFAVGFNRDRARVRKRVLRVGLELDALLEVDEPELDLGRRIPAGDSRDDRVKQRRLARAGLARDERVLAGAFAEQELLQARGARAADGHAQVLRARKRPEAVGLRRDRVEWNFDARGGLCVAADAGEERDERLVGQRRVERERKRSVRPAREAEDACGTLLGAHNLAARGDLVGGDSVGERRLLVAQQDHMHAAALARSQDREHARSRLLAEIRREIRTDEETVGLGDLARRVVVRVDVLELVAEVLLDHRLHVLGDVDEPLLDRTRVGPDALADEQLELVAKMHEGGEALAERDGIEEGEARLRRRDRGQEPREERMHGAQRGAARLGRRLDHEVAAHREAERRGNLEALRHLDAKLLRAREPAGKRGRLDRKRAEAEPGRAFAGDSAVGAERAPRGADASVEFLREAERVARLGRDSDPIEARVAKAVFLLAGERFRLGLGARDLGALGLRRGTRGLGESGRTRFGRVRDGRSTLRLDVGALDGDRVLDALHPSVERLGNIGDRTVEGAVRRELLGALGVALAEEPRFATFGVLALGALLGGADRGEIGLERRPHAAHRRERDAAQDEEGDDHEDERADGGQPRDHRPPRLVEHREHAADHARADHDRGREDKRRGPRDQPRSARVEDRVEMLAALHEKLRDLLFARERSRCACRGRRARVGVRDRKPARADVGLRLSLERLGLVHRAREPLAELLGLALLAVLARLAHRLRHQQRFLEAAGQLGEVLVVRQLNVRELARTTELKVAPPRLGARLRGRERRGRLGLGSLEVVAPPLPDRRERAVVLDARLLAPRRNVRLHIVDDLLPRDHRLEQLARPTLETKRGIA